MAQNEYTTNRKYRHLTREKRAQIEVLLQLKFPKSRIAREVGIARVRTESGAIHALLWRFGTACLRTSKTKQSLPHKTAESQEIRVFCGKADTDKASGT